MQELATREEQIMRIIWLMEKAFIKEIVDEFPDPKPHYNTVATITKILEKKGFLGAEKLGNSYRYFPLVTLEAYREEHLSGIKKKYFSDSFSGLVAHFAKNEDLSPEQIDEILDIIKNKKSS